MNILKINFGSQIGRTEYWARSAMVYTFIVVAALIVGASIYVELDFLIFLGIAVILYLIPYTWNNIFGRLRDTQRTYWWAILFFIPGIGVIFAITLGCFKTPNNDIPASLKDKIIVITSIFIWLVGLALMTILQALGN